MAELDARHMACKGPYDDKVLVMSLLQGPNTVIRENDLPGVATLRKYFPIGACVEDCRLRVSNPALSTILAP